VFGCLREVVIRIRAGATGTVVLLLARETKKLAVVSKERPGPMPAGS
jgi:hypothetical protein